MQEKNINKKIVQLQNFLQKNIAIIARQNKNVNIWHKDLETKVMPFALAGKNMRGLLVMLSAPKVDKNVLLLASALELCHGAFLIHDDIMDQDEKRRGRDSVYFQYSKELKFQDSLHYGISQAISLGDICIFMGFDLLNKINHKNKEKINNFFVRECLKVGLGQMQDVFVGYNQKDPDFETIIEIYKYKTARYSLSLPIALGYMNNLNFNQKILNKIILAGEFLGIAFQMKDDYLGIWGDTNSTGKGVLRDVNKNKKTIIKFLLLKNINQSEKSFVNSIFGKDNLSKNEIQNFFMILDKYKIKDKHEKIILEYNQKAKSLISTLPANLQKVFLFLEKFNNERSK